MNQIYCITCGSSQTPYYTDRQTKDGCKPLESGWQLLSRAGKLSGFSEFLTSLGLNIQRENDIKTDKVDRHGKSVKR